MPRSMGYKREVYDTTSIKDFTCTGPCRLVKSVSDFHKDLRSETGLALPLICEECFKARTRTRHKLDKQRYRNDKPEEARQKYRAWQLNKMYSLTLEQFNNLLKLQNDLCAVCKTASLSTKDLHVDHDHNCCATTPTCGKCTRGILCNRCNLMLGLASDNVEVLKAAITYLEKGTS